MKAKLDGKVPWNKGISSNSPEFRQELKEKWTGENNPRWKGGITPINRVLRTSIEYKEWRKAVKARDNYACQDCGAVSTKEKFVMLHVHHIKPWAHFLELRFNVDNGQTLCEECHRNTDTWGKKAEYQYEAFPAHL